MPTLAELQGRKSYINNELDRRGGAAKAPGFQTQLGAVNNQIGNQQNRIAQRTRYAEANNRLQGMAPTDPNYAKNAGIMQSIGQAQGLNYQNNNLRAPAAPAPAAPQAPIVPSAEFNPGLAEEIANQYGGGTRPTPQMSDGLIGPPPQTPLPANALNDRQQQRLAYLQRVRPQAAQIGKLQSMMIPRVGAR